ncbi:MULTISPECIES: DUF6079 family protein [Dermacoccus]|uniref:DUF6079 family protein n=1 Tax=Dermacoccus TaxID=57495 RepID=UPI0005714533|nr:DUF6079 family protein [Dermacoccus nishinomiyaensis]
MSEYLRDVIDIPDRVTSNDYVLRLTDSVGDDATQRTLDNYVVTPALEQAFDQALGLVGDALQTHESRGAFLAGSFGSGKSHFMAVLHAMLTHQPAARAKAGLQGVIAKHEDALKDAKVLPLAFHLLGATTMEQALFDGYLRQIQEMHPGAPLPALYKSDALLDDADTMRRTLGDERFFAGLNGDMAAAEAAGEAASDDPWADDTVWDEVLATATWDAQRYTEARAASAASESRQELVAALARTYFRSYARQGEYVDIDTGLAAISAHAKKLGYDAVILFLDELVLWLAFGVTNTTFFQREAQKLTKLVESAVGGRAIPIVSFVARQMDLRRWFADSGASGSEQEALDRAFKHQEGRFSVIALGDDNLPYVANQRLLQPHDEKAAATLREAFRGIERRPAVWDVLLDGINTDENHRGADEKAFELTYPFSPALISTLRSLAGVMQRERTALKVMQRMLVDRRDTLTVDDVIPVGDAFDLIVQSESGQPLDVQAAALFRSAQKLYTEKLYPTILNHRGFSTEQAYAEADEMARRTVENDLRLAKTMLMSAVAPEVHALKNLTPQRLAALNHGSIVSPLAGGEASIVLATVRKWAEVIPEIRIEGEGRDAVIRVQLADVDYESIVERAKHADTDAARRELIRTFVGGAIGITDGASADMQGAYALEPIWRGTRRRVDVIFGNVRDHSWLSDDHFRAAPGTWRVIIDHPFDTAGHSSSEDRRRLETMKAARFTSRTFVWLPRFVSDETLRKMRRYVILQWLLASEERWRTNAEHLSEGDRQQARGILEGQRTNLRDSITSALKQAYGVTDPQPGVIDPDESHTDTVTSLDTALGFVALDGTDLKGAFDTLIDRAFSSTYPEHPRFDAAGGEVKVRDFRAVAEAVLRAVDDDTKRAPLAGLNAGSIQRIAKPLGVGAVNDQYFVFGDHQFTPWGVEIEKKLGERAQSSGTDAAAPVTVGELRGWIGSTPQGAGLPAAAVDLIVIAWAALRQRTPSGEPLEALEPGKLSDHIALRQERLPSQDNWAKATTLAQQVFGARPVRRTVTASALAIFEGDVLGQLRDAGEAQSELVEALDSAYLKRGLHDGPRLTTAREVAALAKAAAQLKGVALVDHLASTEFTSSLTAAGKSFATAAQVGGALGRFDWERFVTLDAASAGEGEHADQAAAHVAELKKILADDEFVTSLSEALQALEKASWQWMRVASAAALAGQGAPAAGSPVPTVPGPVSHENATPHDAAPAITRRVATRAEAGNVVDELNAFLAAHPGKVVTVTWQVDE